MDQCEKILAALIKIPRKGEASELAIWLGDLWVERSNLVRADKDYIIAYKNSAKVLRSAYDRFVMDQKQRFFLIPRNLRKGEMPEDLKAEFFTINSVRIITAVVFRIS